MGKDLSAHPAPGGQPTEGRFARLTSNLLARKGHAEPSNAFNPFFGPIVPADRGGTGAAKNEEAPAWLSIVNERSLDAGYPANPLGDELERRDLASPPPPEQAPAGTAGGKRITTPESDVPRLRRERTAPAQDESPSEPAKRASIIRKPLAVAPSPVDAGSTREARPEQIGKETDGRSPAVGDETTARQSASSPSLPSRGVNPAGEPGGAIRPADDPILAEEIARNVERPDPADDLMRLAAAAVAAAASSAAAGALAGADADREDDAAIIRRKANDPGLPRRAAVTFRMSTRDFLRMKLGSAELGISSQDILIEALGEYLDARGVEGLGDCQCLRRAADQYEAATERNAGSGAAE